MIRNIDGYINISKLITEINQKENKNKNLRTFLKSEKWYEIVNEFRSVQNFTDPNIAPIIDLVNVGNEFKGKYVHRDLIHFLCEWASIKYAFRAKHIMDTIDDIVHVELKKDNLNDCPENVKPIMEKIEKSLKDILMNEINDLENKGKFDPREWRNLMSKHSAMNDDGVIDERAYEHMMISLSDNMF
jgi:hypothetical protein